jgi:membrane dipeptidase
MVQLSGIQEAEAQRIHREAVVVDTHCDSLMSFVPQQQRGQTQKRLGERNEKGQVDIPRMVEGGLDCQVFAMYTGIQEGQPDALLKCLRMVDAFYGEAKVNGDRFRTVMDADEIVVAKAAGKVSGMLSIEGAEPLMGDLGVLRVMHRLGVRMLSLTWNWRTPFADGLSAKRTGGKLTDLGAKALEELDRLGIVLDLSHITDECFWDIADLKKGPFVASHSNCRGLCDNARNLTDDMIRSLADHRGVMGMNFVPGFIAKEGASLEKMIDHVDHIYRVVGPDYVGLGADFDGGGGCPGLEDSGKLLNFTRELVRREYCEEDVKKILGGNQLRVFREVAK